MTLEDIQHFCDSNNYDLRLRPVGGSRWIDQKCTPDVVWSISDFVLNFLDTNGDDAEFTANDIWHSDYAEQTIAETFSKPGTTEKSAKKEYDKVFGQPLRMLCFAGIIYDVLPGSRHRYKVVRKDILEFIAKNDLNSLRFLQTYIESVLKQSNLWDVFNDLFNYQDPGHFSTLKTAFSDFYHRYTSIIKQLEINRIFPKVLNPLAYKYQKKGTVNGRLSKNIIIRSDLMYNRDNFRDVYRDKPRGITRQDWLLLHPKIDVRKGYFEQMMSKAKRNLGDSIRIYRNNLSELTNFSQTHTDLEPARHIHHIFPKNEFPEIMHYVENLIALTPNQHLLFAHPNNNTQIVSSEAQKELLIAKTCSIQQNLSNGVEEPLYEFGKFLFVLKTGWDDESVLEIPENEYADVIHAINVHYAEQI
ncbi:MAG: restriction endonuclease [Alphaproteobacteria bacterium]|nr:restriction endonuclease [Alphaproteobacteria bacterium]